MDLYAAAIAGDAHAIAKLEMQADRVDQLGNTILHIESRNGNTERVRFILREFAHKNLLAKLTKFKETALLYAARYGRTEVVEILIDAARHLPVTSFEDFLRQGDKNMNTALHYAAFHGRTEVASILIDAARHLPVTSFQAFLRQPDNHMDTALHRAVMGGHASIVKLLVEADPSDTHIQNYKGETPMYIAVEKRYTEIVKLICTTCTAPSLDGPDGSTVVRVKNLDQAKSPGGTLYKFMDRDALYAAAIAGDADAIAGLEMQADKLYEDEETILHTESKNGNTEHVRFILRKFAHKNLLAKLTKYKHTALHLAIYRRHTEVAEILIDAARHLPVTSFQAFLRQGDKDMDTALHAAVMRGNVAIVKLLVETDPSDTHIQNKEGKTPMYIAVEEWYNDIVEIISTTFTSPSLDGPHGSTVVRIKNLDQGKSPGGPLYKIMDRYALCVAAIAGDADAIAKLEMQADILNGGEETILHVESQNRYAERVRFILREFAKNKLLPKLVSDKQTALHLAAIYGHTEMAEILIDAARHLPPPSDNDNTHDNPVTSFQAFLRQADEDLNTALHFAAEKGHASIVKLLVEADPSDTHIQNDEGKTPMYIAVGEGHNDIVEIISTTCTAPSWDGPDGSTVVRVKNLDQAKSPGGTLYKIMDKDALYAAAIAGDADAIAALEMQADKLYAYDGTILHNESRDGNTEHVRFILRQFASKNLLVKLNNQKETALTRAAYKGHTEVVEVLIDAARHLPPSASDNTHDNPVTSFQAFLRLGDEDMDTALHSAVINNKIEIVKLLVEADPSHRHSQNNDGKTPMYIAVEKRYNDIVKVICTTCTAPSLDGPGGSTVLLAAIKHPDHDIEVVNLLIGAARHLPPSDNDNPVSPFQAFLRQCDEELNTALHLAVLNGKVDIVKLLVEADPTDTHIQNNEGKTPIYMAAERGYIDIVKVICTTCTALPNLDGPGVSTTALHAVIKNLHKARNEDRDVIRLIIDAIKRANNHLNAYEKAKRLIELFNKSDEKRCIILELAVEGNYLDVVEFILAENPVYHLDRDHPNYLLLYDGYTDLIGIMPLIYKARDKEYNDMVNLLTQTYQRGVQNLPTWYLEKMAQLISAIRRRQEESVFSLLKMSYLVNFADNLGWTALHHAAYHEFDSIIGKIVEAQKKFGHPFVYQDMVLTPFHVAAEKGYTSTLKLLLELWPSTSPAYTAVDKNGQNMLHLAALQSKKKMIQDVLKYCSEEYKNKLVNERDNNGDTPLHLLIRGGCFVPELLRYKGVDIRVENNKRWTPPDMLYFEDQIIDDQVQIKIALDGIQIDPTRAIFSSSVLPSKRERKDVIFYKKAERMMHEKYARMKEDTDAIANCFADAIVGDPISKAALEMKADTLNESGETILHVESKKGVIENVRFIVKEFANKSLLGKVDGSKQTALHLAARHGHTQVVEALIDAARHLPSSSANDDAHNTVSSFQDFIRKATDPMRNTALHLAVLNGNVAIVKLLVEAYPNDNHIQNNEGKTPIYIAAENGYKDIIKEICTTCTVLCLDGPGGSTTALHAAILNMHKDEVKTVIGMMINAAKRWSREESSFEALFNRTDDESERTILELAVDRNYLEVVELILEEDPDYQHGGGSKNIGLMRLIRDTTIINEEYKDILKLLTQTYKAKVSEFHKGVIDLIVAIRRRHRVSVIRLLGENKQLVTFVDEDGWTPLHHAAYHEFDAILPVIIEAQKAVQHQFVYQNRHGSTPFHVAAKKGYTLTVLRLMELWPAWSSAYTDVDNDGRNILHLAASQSEREMIEVILKHCPEKYKTEFVNKQDNNGDTPLHLLIKRGCFVPELTKYKGLNTMIKNNEDQTPLDYFYEEDQIIADQVRIKIALDDDIQTFKYWKFWPHDTKRKSNYLESKVLPSRRKAKDKQFENANKELIDKKRGERKKELERYKKRTTTQIIVAALITTVTFTVGFTMPGGLYQSGEQEQGLVVLSKKAAFSAFMVSDAIALLLSTCSLFLYFLESMYDDPQQVSKLNAASVGLNIISVVAMMLTFVTGTYVVLSHSPALAITVCLIGSFFFIFVIVLLIKWVYDRQVKRNED